MNTNLGHMPRATVFYDGECPMCRREINHYRQLRGAGHLLWVDITREETMLEAHGLRRENAMARFHVRDASGIWHIGAWGFVELWSHLPAYRWLAHLLRALGLVPIMDRLYHRFARWRLKRRCSSDNCVTGYSAAKTGAASRATRKNEA